MCDRGRHEAGLREQAVDGALVLEVSGEVDVVTAPLLATRLEALAVGPHPHVVVDLRNVTFMDCSGLSVLCRARRRVTERDGRLSLGRGVDAATPAAGEPGPRLRPSQRSRRRTARDAESLRELDEAPS
ncbi:STAS domain-containing protein [Actinacidiphila glaucinigra]|uniref:STAS domain-containing protein n=1 Tax=Actinacidiphila glaucinigra TaxID=235986 RepID=UPI00386C73BC